MSKVDASHDLCDVSRTSAGSVGSAMRYTPTLQDLRLKRLHLKRSWFTPRKCLAAIAASLVSFAVVVRLTWTLSHAYTQLHSASDTDGELIILPEDSGSRQSGAVCLDGSRPGFYFRRGKSHSKRWLVALPGTGWCWTAEECSRWRSETWLGTTRDIETTHPFSAILSADCETNRVFCEWSVVLVVPCDGASFLGNRTAALHYDGAAMYMRGSAVLTAVLDHLATAVGLSLAEHVVLYGQSSSSLAAVLHVDYVRSLLSSSRRASAVAIADGGVTLGDAIGYKRIADVVRLHGIDDARSVRHCVGSPDNAFGIERCLFVDGAARRTRNRVVLLASLFDPWTNRLLPPVAPPPPARHESPPSATPIQQRQQLYAAELYAQRLLEFVRTPPPPETDRCTVVTTCHVPLLPQPSLYVAEALTATARLTALSTRLPPVVARGGGGVHDGVARLDSVARWLRPTDADRCPEAVVAIEDEAPSAVAGLRLCLPTPIAGA